MSGALRQFLAVAALCCALCACGGASALASTAQTHHDAGRKLSKKCWQRSWRARHPHRCRTTHRAKKSPLPGSLGMASTGPLTAAPILQAASAAAPAPAVAPSVSPVSPPAPVTELPSEVEAPIEPQGEPPSIPHVQVSALEYSFTLSRTKVPAGKVVLQFVNNGQDAHNLHLETGEEPLAEAIGNTPSKGVGNLELELRPGAYTLFCSLPTHEAKGMKAVLEVE
jgi:plastocyanin